MSHVNGLTDAQRHALENTGNFVVRQGLDADEAAQLSIEADNIIECLTPYREQVAHSATKEDRSGLLANVIEKSDEPLFLIDDPRTFLLVPNLLGPYLRLDLTQVTRKEPGAQTVDLTAFIHTDRANLLSRTWVDKRSRPVRVKTHYVLTNRDDPARGNFAAVPGSHDHVPSRAPRADTTPGETSAIAVLMKAGDCVIWTIPCRMDRCAITHERLARRSLLCIPRCSFGSWPIHPLAACFRDAPCANAGRWMIWVRKKRTPPGPRSLVSSTQRKATRTSCQMIEDAESEKSMASSDTWRGIVAASACLAVMVATSDVNAKQRKDRVARDFRYADVDRDGELSRREWNRRGNFDRLDTDGSGGISLGELRALYDGHDARDYEWPPEPPGQVPIEMDDSLAADRLDDNALAQSDVCAIAGRAAGCSADDQAARGLEATGLGPRFPDGALCPGIDDFWAMDYSHKRRSRARHGGIDIPVPWGTPIRAVAQGTVVAIFEADMSKRGIEIVLRHRPEDTGLGFWTYSAYGHLDTKPDFNVGQRVCRGQTLGPTGNSGISSRGGGQSRHRRPAVHFATFRSVSGKYGIANNVVVPQNGYWLDPLAFYRQKKPFESEALKALGQDEKFVRVPVMFGSAKMSPPGTKRIWPYVCRKP